MAIKVQNASATTMTYPKSFSKTVKLSRSRSHVPGGLRGFKWRFSKWRHIEVPATRHTEKYNTYLNRNKGEEFCDQEQ